MWHHWQAIFSRSVYASWETVNKEIEWSGLLYKLIILYNVKGCSFTGYMYITWHNFYACLSGRCGLLMQMYTRPINKRFQLKQDALKHAGTVGSSISEKVLYTALRTISQIVDKSGIVSYNSTISLSTSRYWILQVHVHVHVYFTTMH